MITVTINNDKKTYDADINNRVVKYVDNDYKVTVDYNDTLKIIRENDEYYMCLKFIPYKTIKCECKLIKENLMTSNYSQEISEQVQIQIKYEGYIQKQMEQIEKEQKETDKRRTE